MQRLTIGHLCAILGLSDNLQGNGIGFPAQERSLYYV